MIIDIIKTVCVIFAIYAVCMSNDVIRRREELFLRTLHNFFAHLCEVKCTILRYAKFRNIFLQSFKSKKDNRLLLD